VPTAGWDVPPHNLIRVIQMTQKAKARITGTNMYQIKLQIDGMACGMCEAHVNDAIRISCKVKKVKSSHRKGETVIQSETILSQEQIQEALTPTGYKVIGYSLTEK
jgi:copper chaperone CopZ